MLLTLFLAACSTPAPPAVEAPPEPAATEAAPEPAAPASPLDFSTSLGAVHFEPVHHGTLWFTVGEHTVWVDPWSEADLTGAGKADLVLITDVHPDHLDAEALAAVSDAETEVVAPPAVAEQLGEDKVTTALRQGFSTGAFGMGIESVPMYNHHRGPAEGQLYHPKGRGNGYLLSLGDVRVYIAGDTACTDEMRALNDIDLAFVPMNLPYTMTPEEAAECVRAFDPAVVVPYHYRGSDIEAFATLVRAEPSGRTEVVLRDLYGEQGGQP